MKKLLLFLALGLCTSVFANRTINSKEPTTQEIQIKESTIPSTPVRPRSLLSYTEARVDYVSHRIEVRFNYYLGNLEITITDLSGCPVYSQSVNSDNTPSINLPMPDAGTYRITIAGEGYLAEGDFVIE